MEDITGNMAYFYPHERQLLGIEPGPVPIDTLDMSVHFERLEARRAYSAQKIAEVLDDYAYFEERENDLDQLVHDEAILMDIAYDLAPTQAQLVDALAARAPRDPFELD